MHLIRRSPHDRASIHFALALAAVALMVIVGLLGMHTFSAGSGGHDAVSTSQHHMAVIDAPAAADMGGTLQEGSGEHGTMLTCVLALLVGLLVLISPNLMRTAPPICRWLTAALRWRSKRIPPAPPSLIVLSISRS